MPVWCLVFFQHKLKKENKTQFLEQDVKYNKFDRRILKNKKAQNYSYSRKYHFELIDSCWFK